MSRRDQIRRDISVRQLQKRAAVTFVGVGDLDAHLLEEVLCFLQPGERQAQDVQWHLLEPGDRWAHLQALEEADLLPQVVATARRLHAGLEREEVVRSQDTVARNSTRPPWPTESGVLDVFWKQEVPWDGPLLVAF